MSALQVVSASEGKQAEAQRICGAQWLDIVQRTQYTRLDNIVALGQWAKSLRRIGALTTATGLNESLAPVWIMSLSKSINEFTQPPSTFPLQTPL